MDNESKLIFEQYIKEAKEEDDIGLGPNVPKTVHVTSIGKSSDEESTEDTETVYIQAGDKKESCDCDSDCDCGCQSNGDDYDGELDMARAQLYQAADYAVKLFNHIENVDSLDGWTASKITKAADYLSSVFHYMEYEALNANVEDDES